MTGDLRDRSTPGTVGAEVALPLRTLTFASGGWVVGLSLLFCAVVLGWALLGVFFGSRPVGDGVSPESYAFDLSIERFGDRALAASGQPRDFLRALDDPATVPGTEVAEVNRRERGKFLVSTDRVIGVTINGESRAYPLSVMNAHEVCNDVLGGLPIAVTYSPLTDSVVVFDRRIGAPDEGGSTTEQRSRARSAPRLVRFGVSGLLLDSNTLFYDRDEPAAIPEAPATAPRDDRGSLRPRSLWSQLAMRAVAGPDAAAGMRLRPIAGVQLVTWSEWLERRPQTTVIRRDPRVARRYKEFDYRRYWSAGTPLFPVATLAGIEASLPAGVSLMAPTIVVVADGTVTVRTLDPASAAGDHALTGRTDGRTPDPPTPASPAAPPARWIDAPPGAVLLPMRWFAWRAFESELRP
ncbi:MAG TPA: DUF3179 domain-containing (seleno)protein [Phycisphaerales bacterium]|nr:DUF3179 domain-containing (seleno)protein [Phycisphaerales bacterium]HMP38344.1 DUF3179 domain-containing (seleno)protein [Phycisphaerales bacterium]